MSVVVQIQAANPYDAVHDVWSFVADMVEGRCYSSFVTVDGAMYAVGGYSYSSHQLASVERYDPSLNAWSLVAPMSLLAMAPRLP